MKKKELEKTLDLKKEQYDKLLSRGRKTSISYVRNGINALEEEITTLEISLIQFKNE